MARRKPARRVVPVSIRWQVARDGAGRLQIVNVEGLNVLRHSDEGCRVQNYYLASAAPLLHAVLYRMERRFARYVEMFPDRRDSGLLIDARCALSDSHLPMKEVVTMSRHRQRRQLELLDRLDDEE